MGGAEHVYDSRARISSQKYHPSGSRPCGFHFYAGDYKRVGGWVSRITRRLKWDGTSEQVSRLRRVRRTCA